ncbi:UvrD-helicase domain-containing protein, partial [Staphylococcus aureus]
MPMNNNIKSIWITANAGSGKTTALTERVVRL